MTKNYFAPHKIVAKNFRTPSKIIKKFTPPICAPPGYPELKMASPYMVKRKITERSTPPHTSPLQSFTLIINAWIVSSQFYRRQSGAELQSYFSAKKAYSGTYVNRESKMSHMRRLYNSELILL